MARLLSRRGFARALVAAPAPVASIDIGPERRILNRAAFGPNATDLQDIVTSGWSNWIDDQIDWRNIDDSATEAGVAALTFPNLRLRATGRFAYRCMFSKHQLRYRLTHFWDNHFNTDAAQTEAVSEQVENERFSHVALDGLEDLLLTSAQSAAMVEYLDNDSNIAAAPNENYARELLELHAMGVDNGYDDNDVAELARVFTGWALVKRNFVNGQPTETKFFFRPGRHDNGPKSVLGWSTPGISGGNGVQEGVDFLAYLARRTETQQFIARKLCTYFVDDSPPESLVQDVAVAIAPPNTVADAVRVIMNHVANDPTAQRNKTADAQEFVLMTLRRLGATVNNIRAVTGSMGTLGQPVFAFPVPTGYPEVGGAWNGAASLLSRWNFIHLLTTTFPGAGTPAISVNWIQVLGLPAPTTFQDAIDRLILHLFDGDLPTEARDEILQWIQKEVEHAGATVTPILILSFIPDIAGVLLRLPEANTN